MKKIRPLGHVQAGRLALVAGLLSGVMNASLAAGPSTRAPEDLPSAKSSFQAVEPKAQATTNALGDVTKQGRFGPVFDWPTIPLHMALLPDGRVLGFGSHPTLDEGTQHYVVWTPTLGTGANAFVELANTTNTNIFCSGVSLVPGSGDVFIVGGTRKVNGEDNYAIDDFSVFRYREDTLVRLGKQSMNYRRWYPTVLQTWDDHQLVIGGRDDNDLEGTDPPVGGTFSTTPELYVKGEGWRALPGAKSEDAFGRAWDNWWYPRAFLSRQGQFLLVPYHGQPYALDPVGKGYLQPLKMKWPDGFPISLLSLPAVTYAPHQVLHFGKEREMTTVDLRGPVPVPSVTDPISLLRQWANATVQADGKVFVSGGSLEYNDLATAHYRTETWDPETGHWTRGAVHVKARMYHSVAMLLPDATIVTGAGGSPGPQTNPNAEIYYPPYLFKKDGSGEFAPRPAIEAAPSTALTWDEPFHIRVSAGTAVSRVTFLRTGAVTHAFNANQQLIEMPFEQDGQRVDLKTPKLAVDAPAGFYLLFVFDQEGVPSVARFIRLMDTGSGIPPPPPPDPSRKLVVYDGASFGYTPFLGTTATCDRCRANVKAPVVDATAGETTVRLQLPPLDGITAASFHGISTLPVAQYRALRLSVLPTQENLRFRVTLGTDGPDDLAVGPEDSFVVKNLTPNAWNVVSIPMSAFASATQFNRVRIASVDADGTAAFYLDNLVLLPNL